MAFTGVIHVSTVENGQSMGTLVGYGHAVVFNGELSAGNLYTLYSCQVDSLDPVTLSATSDTKQVLILEPSVSPVFLLKELCAGMCGIGIGFEFVGGRVIAACDKTSYACSHLSRNYSFPIVCGSITDEHTIYEMQLAGSPVRCLYSLGFPCQPFSSQGDQKGLQDIRCAALWGSLRCMYLHQAVGAILECVPAVSTHTELQEAFSAFCQMMQWAMSSTVLDLSAQWPGRRSRWWAVCCSIFHPPTLVSWPVDSYHRTVGQVIGEWPVWAPEDERDLCFTKEETEKFADPQFGSDARRLELDAICPTLLHSYGHSLSGCPCLCRGRFTEVRLKTQGLRGFGIRSSLFPFERFLHCHEAAFLSTVPASVDFLPGRTELPLIGQLAAPLQSVWVSHSLFQALHAPYGVTHLQSAEECIQACKAYLFQQRHHVWTWHASLNPSQVAMVCFDDDSLDLSFKRAGRLTVGQLIAAESAFLNWGETIRVFDGHRPLFPDAVIQARGFEGPYRLLRGDKKQKSQSPGGLIAIQVVVDSGCFDLLIAAGSFVFEVLLEAGLPIVGSFRSDAGLPIALDSRLWQSSRLIASSHRALRTGYGSVSSDMPGRVGGLTHTLIAAAAGFLLRQAHAFGLSHQVFLYGMAESFGWPEPLFGTSPPRWVPLPGTHIFFCLSANLHWTLLSVEVAPVGLFVRHLDGFPRSSLPWVAAQILDVFADRFGLTAVSITLDSLLRQQRTDSCGTIALGHFAHEIGILGDLDSAFVEGLHVGLAMLSHRFYRDDDSIGFGPSEHELETTHELAQLLIEKGVAPENSIERAKLGVQKLGLFTVSKALCGPKPWATLKAIASKPQHGLQWIKAEELQKQIQKRAESKFKIQPSQAKKSGPQKRGRDVTQQISVDPTQLVLMPNTFVNGKQPAKQITFDEVKMGATGLAFASLLEVGPLLRQGEIISQFALAILTTSQVPADQTHTLQVQPLRYPAQHAITQEPLLIHGSLIQLGKGIIERVTNGSASIEAVKTKTLRITLFRDAWPSDWSDFTKQPFRSIMQQIPTLQLCRAQGCGDGCKRFHCPVDESVEQLVLDLWGRAYHSLDGRFVKPERAEFWSALMRVPYFAHKVLQELSGTCGAFFEPRCDSGHEPDPLYQVVWLPDMSVADVSCKFRTCPNAVALVRVQSKYGIRFDTSNAEAGFRHLRPSEVYVPVVVQKIWQIMPLPFGTQRSKLQVCLSQLPWEVKVLQQISSSAAGAVWEVGASTDPPCKLFQLDNQDVMITFVREAVKSKPSPIVVASSGTRDYLKGTASSSSKLDPWLKSDPWANYAAGSGTQPDKVKQLEERMMNDLASTASQLRNEWRQSVPEAAMEVEGNAEVEARFARLESTIVEVQAHGAKMENWVSQLAASSQQTNAQVAQLHQGLATQYEQVDALQKEVHSNGEQLRSIKDEVRSEMEKGMVQITALLEKRTRTE